MLSQILPTNIWQLMDWTINHIGLVSEHQEMLCRLSLLNQNQIIIITFSDFINR